MRLSGKDEAKCPEGYRRYVYRVKVGVPFKDQFREIGPLPPDNLLQKRLSKALRGAEVRIERSGDGESGRVIVYFYSDRELHSICRHIGITFRSQFRTVGPLPPDNLLQKRLSKALRGAEVRIERSGDGERGRVIVYFYSDRELRSICSYIID